MDAGTTARDQARAIAALGPEAGWADGAAVLLRDLGFSLIHSDRPWAPEGSHLIVALRAAPTLRHFDPETVSYWTPGTPHARQASLDRASVGRIPLGGTDTPTSRRVLWGHVHLVDRLSVENRFLTFGGELRTAIPDPGTILVDIRSPAPIVRWGGHSQDTDPLAAEVGAFFGRLIVPVDYAAGAERRLTDAEPEVLYAAFLAWADARLDRIAAATGQRSAVDAWIDREQARLRGSEPAVLTAGEALLVEVGLAIA
ncbi:MAG TPA: hypothetical protein VET90_01215 [Candidatus Binatus sp.]|nr:hypothetical protein [Candidatus Binatus sp.]